MTVAVHGSALAQLPATPPATPAGPAPAVAAPPTAVDGAPTYERRGRRDPFEPVTTLQPGMTSPVVASARLKGILRGRTPRVLVETADGLGYILIVGDMLADGRLIEIGADSVVFSVPAGPGATANRVVLRLPDD